MGSVLTVPCHCYRRCLRTLSLSTFTTFPASLSYNLYNDELHFRDLVTFIGVWTHFYCLLSLSSFLFRFCFWINLKWSPETDNLRVQGEVPLSLQQIGGLVFPRLLKPHPRLIKKPPVRVLLRPGRRGRVHEALLLTLLQPHFHVNIQIPQKHCL